jgi:hypothetical protein
VIRTEAGQVRADEFDRKDETITLPRKSFNEVRVPRVVAERAAQLLDGCVQAQVELDECIVGPELLLELFAGNQLAGPFEQQGENAKGLLGDSDPNPLPANLPRP